jgi:hypothetical protein
VSRNDRIVLVHSPDTTRLDLGIGWYTEEHTVLDVQQVSGTDEFIVSLGTRQGQTITPEMLQHDYHPDSFDREVGDAIARLDAQTLSAADYFDAADDLVMNSVFPESFVQYIMLDTISIPGLNVPLPHITTGDQQRLQHLADRWCSVASPTPAGSRTLANHQLLLVVDNDAAVYPASTDAGLTISQVPAETSSFVFRGTIDDIARNRRANPEAWAMKTAAHELAHQWDPEKGLGAGVHHCPKETTVYDNSAIYCLLAEQDIDRSEAQRANGIARFHLIEIPNTNIWHSEYLEIRQHPDPFLP